MTTRILLAEDIKLVAEAFEALLSVEPEFEVVARVARGDDLVTSATRLFPDVILADIDMPGMTGIEATRMLRDKGYRGRIILLTALPGSGHLHAAMVAGADGYLLKSITAPSLINAIRAVCNGQSAIDPNVAAVAMRKGPSPLNDRETEILRLVADGSSTAQIASRLYLSKGTVRNYLSTAMSKLDADSRTAAVTRAREEGWL
ncbi:response regulator transcription factor [Cutibacterium avidum]|uniref:response regulator n=1 Tax=Cutibacterium avidum TaxID=33010 RepID=UPI00192BA22B|nr:response regulator transcription factor [Cutibacterium avidum]QQY15758.1 response regulator transcription factor [Cutibacterium avidum]